MTVATVRNRSQLYGEIAFAAVVLAVFIEQFRPGHPHYATWQVAVVVPLGLVYTVIGILGLPGIDGGTPGRRAAYFLTECTLVTAMLLVWPQKGFFAICAMPILSIAVMELPWYWSALVVGELWAATLGTVGFTYGWSTALQSFPGYATPFIFTAVFSFVTRQALRAKLEAEQLSGDLAAANEQLQLHATQVGEIATTRERNRVAREIHDGIGHYLTTINVQLEAAQAVFDAKPMQARTAIEKATRLSREALDEVRRSVGALRADAPRPALNDSLQALAGNLGLPVVIQQRGEPRPLAPAVEIALYRAAQEALTNVARHARATHTELTLDYLAPAVIRLTIADNGSGAPAAPAGGGYGLTGVRERVELLGGRVTFGNRPEGGFAVQLEVPA